MEFKPYHKSLEHLHIGCEKPRAYFIPYHSEQAALSGDRDRSEHFINLCGDWDFKFYQTFEDVPADLASARTDMKLKVPKCWQTELGKGFDVPLYSNLFYPFPLDPPHVPQDNPTGHYRRTVKLDKKPHKKYYINFEGVSSCFYLFINGSFAAYSQVSHCTREVDITEYAIDGENTIDVLVVKWCDGSYLEDQDMFRLSGIFREVYILERDENHIADIYIKYSLSADLDSAALSADIAADGDISINYKLIAPNGEIISDGGSLPERIADPVLWSSESPELYTLLVSCGSEVIPFKIGFKRVEIRGNIAYFNNKPIKLYGINRHDSDPDTGYYATVEHMKRDLEIIKQGNCNTVRTSHYPNDPRFLDLCSEYGIMVVDEADIETHGMGFEYRDTWDWMRWSKLSIDDEWEPAYVDRAERLFERDKNASCVIMWSLGNESGCGKNHRAMRNYIKSRDPEAIVHYENAHLEFKAVPIGENYSDISDVESRMYASLEYTEEYCKNKNAKKPFFFCEFCCSMSTGDIHAHCDMFRNYPHLFGGCFWELTDHGVDIGGGRFRYGGDFGDFPNNSICCVDGVVFPDRRLRPGYYDMKKAYQPFEAEYSDGSVKIFNRRYFESLGDLEIEWSVEVNGGIVLTGKIDATDIPARSATSYKLFDDAPLSDCCYLNLFFKLKSNCKWASAGYELGYEQFDLSCEGERLPLAGGKLEFIDGSRFVEITAGDIKYVFDKPYGRISSACVGGKELLSAPTSVEIWMAHGYNQLSAAEDRKSAAMQAVSQQTYDAVIEPEVDALTVRCHVAIGGPAVVPVITGELIYRFYGDGSATLGFRGKLRELLREMNMRLPRFGFRFTLNDGFERMDYFGKGPVEAYPDRHRSQRYGRFTPSVEENFVPYIRPIENGAHYGSRYGAVESGEYGMIFAPVGKESFIFNASHYTPHMLESTAHNDELVPDKRTYVYLDYQFDVRGGRGYYETVEPERKWDFEPIEFTVAFKPYKGEIDPFEFADTVR